VVEPAQILKGPSLTPALSTLVSLGEQAWLLAQLAPVAKRAKAEAAARKSFPSAELPWEAETSPNSWLDMSDRMEASVLAMLGALWEEVRAIEIVLDEVARKFDGEDPLRPLTRGILNGTRKKLNDLHDCCRRSSPSISKSRTRRR